MARLHKALEFTPARWTVAIAWSALLTLLLLQPDAQPVIDLGLPRGDNTLARELAFSALHLLAFSVTAALWIWTLSAKYKLRTSLILACLIAFALGGVTEYLQSFTLDRHASWNDLVANFAGALIAARLIWRRSHRQRE